MSWLKKNLKLSWIAAEDYPALTEIRFRRAEHPSESWEYVRKTLIPNLQNLQLFSLLINTFNPFILNAVAESDKRH